MHVPVTNLKHDREGLDRTGTVLYSYLPKKVCKPRKAPNTYESSTPAYKYTQLIHLTQMGPIGLPTGYYHN